MAKLVNRLTARAIEKLKTSGLHHDGRGLYLQVTKSGSKSWLYRYERDGKGHWHGLGSYPTVSLATAREKADQCRQLRDSGKDPIKYNKTAKLTAQGGKTFRECATAYIDAHGRGWKNEKHAAQWFNTLQTYAFPVLGELPVQDIDTPLVLDVLNPIWRTKTETATRVRQRVEAVLDWAAVAGHRSGENPARWRGHLDKTLPKRSKVQKVKHFNALPYRELPAFFNDLQQRKAISARALAFTILTACRTGEVRAAAWSEIDRDTGVWTIPAERMKADRRHRVPLVANALKILEEVSPLRTENSDYVFPGLRVGRPLSDAAMRKFLQEDLGYPALTVHGFRSSFRDWCAETTNFPRELAEVALAHVLADKTEAAYQRGDMLERRRELMQAWTDYLTATQAK